MSLLYGKFYSRDYYFNQLYACSNRWGYTANSCWSWTGMQAYKATTGQGFQAHYTKASRTLKAHEEDRAKLPTYKPKPAMAAFSTNRHLSKRCRGMTPPDTCCVYLTIAIFGLNFYEVAL